MMNELRFRVSLLFAAISLSILATAHGVRLSGTVTDHAGSPIVGASVRVVELEQSASTDESGRFSFTQLPMSTYTVKVSAIGSASASQQVQLATDQDLLIILANATIDLKEVSITPRSEATLTRTLSALDMELRPVQTAQDLLKMVPGLFIAQHAGGGKAEQIFIRGFDSDHGTDILLNVDGMPVNMVSHAHGQGYADLHFVIPETVERIDVHKGPYTTRFGDLSTSGTVEFGTRDHIDDNLIKVERGMFNAMRAVALLDILRDKHLLSRRQEHLYVAGEFARTDGYFDREQDLHRFNLFAKYSGMLSARTHLSFTASTFGTQWNASGQVPERAISAGLIDRFGAINADEGGSTGRTNLNAVVRTRMRNDAVLKNQLYYVKYDFELFSDFTFFLQDPINGDMIDQQDDRHLLGYNGTYTDRTLIGDLPFKWAAGIGVRYDKSDIRLLHAARRVVLDTIRSGDLDQLNWSAYLDGTLDLSERWTLNVGTRLDVFDFRYTEDREDSLSGQRMLHRVSPKLDIRYQATDNVQYYLRSGQGFHSNDARSVVLRGSRPGLPVAYGLDLGSTFKPAPRVIMNAALWGIHLEGEIVYVGDGGTMELNTPTQRLGVDLGVRYQITDRIHADADVNYSYGRLLDVPTGEDRIPLAPQFTAVGGLAYRQENGISATVRYSYMGDRPANGSNSVVAKGYFLVDAGASYRTGKMEFGVSVENLMNTEWNQAQFDTKSRLRGEATPVSELHFTPGTPIFIKGIVSYRF
jgi:outer membrane receptor protein involved in Fe transport